MGLFCRKKKFPETEGEYLEVERKSGGAEKSSDSRKIYASASPEDRKRMLIKRLVEMTDKIDEISTQIYHLQQRIEVLEKKTGIGRGE